MKKIRLLLGTLLLLVLALSCGNNGEKNGDKSKGEENKKLPNFFFSVSNRKK